MNRRTLFVTCGWVGAAVLAVLVGLGAVSVIGDGLTSPETRPLSAAEVADELAKQQGSAVPTESAIPTEPATSPSASVTSPSVPATIPPASTGSGGKPSPSASATTAAVTRTFPTRGGTIVARCAGDSPEIVSMSPRQGFELHEQDRGPQQDNAAEGEFRSQDDNHDRIKFQIVCSGGAPSLVERADNSGGSDD